MRAAARITHLFLEAIPNVLRSSTTPAAPPTPSSTPTVPGGSVAATRPTGPAHRERHGPPSLLPPQVSKTQKCTSEYHTMRAAARTKHVIQPSKGCPCHPRGVGNSAQGPRSPKAPLQPADRKTPKNGPLLQVPTRQRQTPKSQFGRFEVDTAKNLFSRIWGG